MKATAKMFSMLGAKRLGKHKGRHIFRYRKKTYVESKEVIKQQLGTGETLSARYMVRTDGGKFFEMGRREVALLFPNVKWEFFQEYVDKRGISKVSLLTRFKNFIFGD